MPGVAAVEDGEGLREVVVEEAEGGEGPGLVVDAVDEGGEEEDERAGWGGCLLLGGLLGGGLVLGYVPAYECLTYQNYSFPFRGSS